MRGVVAVSTLVLIGAIIGPATAQVVTAPSLCDSTVAHYRDGRLAGQLCESDALSKGFTIIDLGDAWVPFGLRGDDVVAAPGYRDTYLALANQEAAATTDIRSRGLGFYGIFPTLSLIASRMEEDARYQCHAAIMPEPVASLGKRLVEENAAVGKARVRVHIKQRGALELEMQKRDLPSLEALAIQNDYFKREVERLEDREARTRTIRMVQKHLLCESEIVSIAPLALDGVLSWRTTRALRLYQRQHLLAPNGWIDETTFALIQEPQRNNDWRAALRVLRERVVDGTGLIEDGSAINEVTPVLEQTLDPLALVWPVGHSPSALGEQDLIGAATDRAAHHIGWRDAASVVQFIRHHAPVGSGPLNLRVAIELPPLPSYYSKHMDLRVVIDLGTQTRARKASSSKKSRRPALLLYAEDGVQTRLLARWPTTIGGWQDERLASGVVVERFKASDTGDFVWKNLYMAPRWLAPQSTPHNDVIERNEQGAWSLNRDVLGPSFRSAYGLAMLIMHRPYQRAQ